MLRIWVRDLKLGMRFAATGGREGWTRTVLTAVGVGLDPGSPDAVEHARNTAAHIDPTVVVHQLRATWRTTDSKPSAAVCSSAPR
ncbi:hypothetical protein MBT84_00375 [Streptomyces sp. MBT84]|nr:hypothetical protein [Streptomyces sp. MBT84]